MTAPDAPAMPAGAAGCARAPTALPFLHVFRICQTPPTARAHHSAPRRCSRRNLAHSPAPQRGTRSGSPLYPSTPAEKGTYLTERAVPGGPLHAVRHAPAPGRAGSGRPGTAAAGRQDRPPGSRRRRRRAARGRAWPRRSGPGGLRAKAASRTPPGAGGPDKGAAPARILPVQEAQGPVRPATRRGPSATARTRADSSTRRPPHPAGHRCAAPRLMSAQSCRPAVPPENTVHSRVRSPASLSRSVQACVNRSALGSNPASHPRPASRPWPGSPLVHTAKPKT